MDAMDTADPPREVAQCPSAEAPADHDPEEWRSLPGLSQYLFSCDGRVWDSTSPPGRVLPGTQAGPNRPRLVVLVQDNGLRSKVRLDVHIARVRARAAPCPCVEARGSGAPRWRRGELRAQQPQVDFRWRVSAVRLIGGGCICGRWRDSCSSHSRRTSDQRCLRVAAHDPAIHTRF
jgi:hypothetical protein